MALPLWKKCIIGAVIFWLFLVGLAILVFYLVVKPRNPTLTVDQGSIQGYNLTQDGHLHNTTFDMIIRSYNRNTKLSVLYDSVDVQIYLHDGPLVGSGTILGPPFIRHPWNETMLKVHVVALDLALDPKVVSDLRGENAGGEVELDVIVTAIIRFRLGSVTAKSQPLKGRCSPVVVNLSSSKSFQMSNCHVEVKNEVD